MGAIYISPVKDKIPQAVYDIFQKKGFKKHSLYINENKSVLIFQKQLFNTINKYSIQNTTLYIIGSCFYKNKNYEDGIKQIVEDYANNKFNSALLNGSYFLLFYRDSRFEFYSDDASIQNIFYNQKTSIISSSFLACSIGAAQYIGKLKINKLSVTEILVTGNLIGPDTLFEEIKRYEPRLDSDLPDIKRIKFNKESFLNKQLTGNDFEKEIQAQLTILENYFSSLHLIFEELGVTTGLTGGFDSRLILFLLNKSTNNYSVYSTKKQEISKQLKIANQITKELNKTLITPSYQQAQNLDLNTLYELTQNNFYFNDGLIRTHQLWHEEIKSRKYLGNLYGKNKINLSGVGGEQYRNSEYLLSNNYSFKHWIYNELIYKYAKNPFPTENDKQKFLTQIQKKVEKLLGLKSSQKISKNSIKRYYNEIWNPANRTIRNNIENQLIFFLSPFTDFLVSNAAYNAITKLGWNHKFEKKMLHQLKPSLSNIPLDYGYSINDRIPSKYYLIGFLKSILGANLFYKITLFNKYKKKNTASKIVENHPEFRKYIKNTENLNLPINISSVLKSEFLSTLIIEVGFFIDEMKNYINND